MIESIRKMWKIEELRKKILYTFMMLVLFRLVGVIPAPGVDIAKVMSQNNTSSLPLLELVNMMTGNAFSQMTLMAMGITPYINASIIMQLLTIAIPALERMSKEDDGREKINRITRYVTVGLAALQAIGLVRGLGYIRAGWLNYVLVGVSMAGGTALAMWIGERREGRRQRRVPPDLRRYHFEPVQRDRVRLQHRHDHRHDQRLGEPDRDHRDLYPDDRDRHLRGTGRAQDPPADRQAGEGPPRIRRTEHPHEPESGLCRRAAPDLRRNMYTGSVWYMIISALLIIAFTFFYSSISFDPKQQAEQLQQQGAVIPGQRGRNIRQYLQNIMNRLNLFAALFLAILAAVPTLLLRLAGVQVPFAASSILIAVSVSLETVRTIQGEMSVRGIDMDMDNVGFM